MRVLLLLSSMLASAAIHKMLQVFNVPETAKASDFETYYHVALDGHCTLTGNDVTSSGW